MPEQTNIEKTLELEEIDPPSIYRSKLLWKPVGARGVFGGQMIGLALSASLHTVSPDFSVHSLHCYFLLPGDNSTSMVYRVEELRTGKSYCSRYVVASQKGRNIFTMMVSFTKDEPSRLKYQEKMPSIPHPDQLKSDEDRLRGFLKDPAAAKFHKSIEMRLAQPLVIERKSVPSRFFAKEGETKNKIMIWLKAHGTLPNDETVHQCVAAYCSDFELLNAALVPFNLHRISTKRVKAIKMMASLDHSIWFHEDFRADEWLLYEIEAGKTGSGRGFASGRIWTLDGRLVISTAQEGVIRVGEDEPELDDVQVAKL